MDSVASFFSMMVISRRTLADLYGRGIAAVRKDMSPVHQDQDNRLDSGTDSKICKMKPPRPTDRETRPKDTLSPAPGLGDRRKMSPTDRAFRCSLFKDLPHEEGYGRE